MQEKDNKASLIIGLSILATIICFGLCVYFTLWALLGELPAQGMIMILGWLPCIGLVLLEILVYIYGLYCRRSNSGEAKKMIKSTWILGILTNAYIVVVSLFFVISDFTNLNRYLIVTIASALNFFLLILWARKFNKKM